MPSAYTYLALKNSRIYVIDKDFFLEIINDYPEFGNFIRQRAVRRMSYWQCIELGYQKFILNGQEFLEEADFDRS